MPFCFRYQGFFLHIFLYFAGNHESESARYRCRSARFFLLQPFRFVLVTRREMHTRTRTTISPFSFKFIFPRCSFSRFQYVGRRKKERRRSDPLPDRSGSGGKRKRETGKELGEGGRGRIIFAKVREITIFLAGKLLVLVEIRRKTSWSQQLLFSPLLHLNARNSFSLFPLVFFCKAEYFSPPPKSVKPAVRDHDGPFPPFPLHLLLGLICMNLIHFSIAQAKRDEEGGRANEVD